MSASAGPDSIRVLVADDHPLFRASVTRAVQMHPQLTLVGEAEDGRAALAAVRELQPDVAVVDLLMPGLDGTQIAEAVAAESLPTRVIPTSGNLHGEPVHRVLQRGVALVFCPSSSMPTALTDAILAVARGETVIAPEAQEAVAGEIRMRATVIARRFPTGSVRFSDMSPTVARLASIARGPPSQPVDHQDASGAPVMTGVLGSRRRGGGGDAPRHPALSHYRRGWLKRSMLPAGSRKAQSRTP